MQKKNKPCGYVLAVLIYLVKCTYIATIYGVSEVVGGQRSSSRVALRGYGKLGPFSHDAVTPTFRNSAHQTLHYKSAHHYTMMTSCLLL